MSVTRRTFVKGSAVAGGAALGAKFLFDGSDTLAHVEKDLAETPVSDEVVRTTCWIGKQDCGMLARKIDGRVVKFEGLVNNPRNQGTLCPKGQAQIQAIYDPHRVKTPLVRTNAKGVTGEWREATWDEALKLTADELNKVRDKDKKQVLWQKGRSKAKVFYDEAFVKAIGSEKMGHGAYCSDAGYRALEYTIGPHGVLHPDFHYTNYLLSWGWNITNAGGNKTCFITWPQQMLKARERGMKIVQIDPRLRPAGQFADEWLPIKPGTDLALALALCNVLISNGHIDEPYLKTYTNSAYLVGPDGTFMRDGETELVWDVAAGAPAPPGAAADPALVGNFTVADQQVRPAFDVFKEHVASATPAWAADICGLPADQISEIGRTFGEQAQIGSTAVVDGVEVPNRPVAIMAYHMSQQELGFQTLRAMTMAPMLVGAMGAVGGQQIDWTWKVHKNYEAFADIEVEPPPYDYTLKNSKFFPINSGLPGIYAQAINDPEEFEVDKLPKAIIFHMVNPIVAFASQTEFLDAYKKVEFAVVLSPWMSETADYFADVVLPAATIEKYEGPLSATDQYVDGTTLRLPPMDPLFDSRGEIDIYLDLTEAMGALYGEKGYLAKINEFLELEGEFALALDTKPTVRDIFNRWALMEGLEGGIEYFEKNGTWVKGAVKPTKRYGYVYDPPFGGAIHRLYGESLLVTQRKMQTLGAEKTWWQDYTALPTWRAPTMDSSPSEYDLTLISYKLISQKQSRTSFIPLLGELAPEQRLDINPKTAEERGIKQGDSVVVESQNAVTGETRRVTTEAAFTEGMRPDTVGMPHHYGLWTMPWTKGQGPTPNTIFYTGKGYVTNTADQSFQVRVRVFRDGGGN